MAIAGATLLSTMLISLYTKINLKPYILYGEILVLFITFVNMFNSNSTILLFNTLLYLLSFVSVLKYFNIKFYRIINIIFGFLLLITFIYVLIEPVVIASIISIASILIILGILYLSEIEDSFSLSFISLVLLIPYFYQ